MNDQATDSSTGETPEPTTPIEITWRGRTYHVALTQYADDWHNTCIAILDKSGVLACKASVNLHALSPHMVYIKNYSENRGIQQALAGRGLINPTGHSVRNGSEEFEQFYIGTRLAFAFGLELPSQVAPAVLNLHASQSTPLDRVATPSTPTDESSMDESPTSFAGMTAQQNAALIEAAQNEKAAREAQSSAHGEGTDSPELAS